MRVTRCVRVDIVSGADEYGRLRCAESPSLLTLNIATGSNISALAIRKSAVTPLP